MFAIDLHTSPQPILKVVWEFQNRYQTLSCLAVYTYIRVLQTKRQNNNEGMSGEFEVNYDNPLRTITRLKKGIYTKIGIKRGNPYRKKRRDPRMKDTTKLKEHMEIYLVGFESLCQSENNKCM